MVKPRAGIAAHGRKGGRDSAVSVTIAVAPAARGTGLVRALLHRLHAAGRGAWEQDPVAGELMAFAAEKYAALADELRDAAREYGTEVRSRAFPGAEQGLLRDEAKTLGSA